MKRLLVSVAFWSTFCWTSALATWAQQGEESGPAVHVLHVRDTHRIAGAMPSTTTSACDASGNVYYELYGPVIGQGKLLRISRDGQEVRPIALPTGPHQRGEWHFALDATDGLYAIFSDFTEAVTHTLFHFSASGQQLNSTPLALPGDTSVRSFAVLPNGKSMVLGSKFPGPDSPTQNDTPVAMWLDAEGRLLRTEPAGKPFDSSAVVFDGSVTVGRADTFLHAKSTEVRVFSAGGDLQQAIPLRAYPKGSIVLSLQFVDGHIAVDFAIPVKTNAVPGKGAGTAQPAVVPEMTFRQSWLLVNPVTGALQGIYEAPKDLGGSPVCYLGREDFLLFGFKDGNPVFLEATY